MDLRKVNQNMRPLNYPLPVLGQITDVLGKAKYFTVMDIQSAYNIIPVEKESRSWLSFSEPTIGAYQYTCVPFGLQNSAAVFLMVLAVVLEDLLYHGVVSYVDDLLIYGTTLEEHNQNLEKVLQRFALYGIRVAAKKVELLAEEVTFLSYMWGRNGYRPCPSKVAALSAMMSPKNVGEVRTALGMFNYYRRFVKDFSKIARPVTALTGNVPFA